MMDFIRKASPFGQLAILLGLMSVCFVVFGVLIQGIFPAISGGYTMVQAQDPAIMSKSSVVSAFRISQFFYTFVVFLVPGVLFAWAMGRPAQYLRLNRGLPFMQLVLAVLVLMCSLYLVGASAEWNKLAGLPQRFHDMEKMAERQTKIMLQMPDSWTMFKNLLLMALLPAIAEEVFFRGCLQRIVQKMVRNGWVAVLITALIFSAIHMQFLTFLPRVILGFVIGAVFLVTGNLWLAIAGHFINNGMQVVLFYLYQSKMISRDPAAEEQVPFYLAIFSAVITGLLIWRLGERAKQAGYNWRTAETELKN
ncbi:CPBP family intramembrane glutamic endopeptidase [Chitinophaga deserti]|uniref:CPBP family intramembrane glutamic endopeptidase n=1 Tax=Chitinophaga deserti TaxID=2164099 RepID=UPI000D6CA748|nr:CPBP family intramembrane glutamic endopeptidase [Chitinophaga deserti]